MFRYPMMALALLLGLGSAQASVVYDWTTTSISNANLLVSKPDLYDPGTLTFADADVAAGSLITIISCGFAPCSTYRVLANYGSNPPTGTLLVNVVFKTDGTLSGTLVWQDVSMSVQYDMASIANGTWAGLIGQDGPFCGPTNRCPITGFWQAVAVPEPSSLLLLAFGFGLLAIIRRRATAAP